MNWDVVRAIAESVGAIGVIVTLIHLARQVRENTASMQASTVLRAAEILQSIRRVLWEDVDGTRVYISALGGLPPEDPEAAARQRLFWCEVGRAHEAVFFQYQAGQLPDAAWKSHVEELRLIWCTPGGAAAMEAFSNGWLHHSFVTYLRELQRSTPVGHLDEFRARWSDAQRRQHSKIAALSVASADSRNVEESPAGVALQ